MIILNSISKVVGRGGFRTTVLENVNWLIKPRTRVVVLGHGRLGAPTLLDIIGGTTLPTSGWVERRATVSVPRGLLRYALRGTTRELVARLSCLYRVDAKEVNAFVAEGFESGEVLDVPAQSLPRQLRSQLSIVLTYAFPYDFYLFNSLPTGMGDPKFQAFCQRALELRSRQAGIILSLSSSRVARRLDPTMMGAVIYRGNLTLYRRLTDAITVFESLPPPEEAATLSDIPLEDQFEDEDIFVF